jgi:acyl-coenzyme A synthetase/AMP-(fatty) acid ligase
MDWIDLSELLQEANAPRLIAHEPALTHAHWLRDCLTYAAFLHTARVARVALWFTDAAELACALFACWRAGVTAVLPGDLQQARWANLDAAVDLWLSDAPLPAMPVPQFTLQAVREHFKGAPLPPASLDRDLAQAPSRAPPSVQLLTSGSSGTPKVVTKSWAELAAEVQALEAQWPTTVAEAAPVTVMGSVNPQHMYGLPFRVLWPLCRGRPIVRKQLVYPEELQKAALDYAPCVWITSPALLKRCGEHLDWPALRTRVVAVFSAGGPLPAVASEAFASRLGRLPTEIYGSSETGVIAWRGGAQAWQRFANVVVGPSGDGTLWVESPWLSARREQTADVVEFQQDQRFQLLGRADRILKIEETRVALPMVEDWLAQHPYVEGSYVGRKPGATRLTALVAVSAAGLYALRNGGRQRVVAALHEHLAQALPSLAIPRHWRFLRQLPVNTQDKLQRQVFETLAGPRPLVPELRSLPPSADGEQRYAIEIPLDLRYFSGHFASTPVVPGVAQIGWAFDIARRDIKRDLCFGGIEVLKFQQLLRPGDVAELTLRWNASNGKLYFAFLLAGEPCSSGRILHKFP